MELQEIIDSMPSAYNPEIEKIVIKKVKSLEVTELTSELADLLGFAISEKYNKLAKTIFNKDYNGRRIDLKSFNNVIINQSEEKYSLLHFAAQFGNKEILIYCLDNGVALSVDRDLFTPLHTLAFASNVNKKDVVEIIVGLKEQDPEIVNKKDSFHLTALHYAAHNDNMPTLEALIANGARR